MQRQIEAHQQSCNAKMLTTNIFESLKEKRLGDAATDHTMAELSGPGHDFGSSERRKGGSGPGSTDGKPSLQMAGSEQMNFLIATNYSAAKINLEQFKQQVPSQGSAADARPFQGMQHLSKGYG